MKHIVKCATLLLLAALAACSRQPPTSEPLSGGNPRVGQQLVARYGCAACHEIKGIAHADSKVGPSLTEIRDRSYVGGVLPHSAGNLVKWIMHPRAYSPNTAMPELGVSEGEARDMAAYLYSQ
ncbi:c-type cytochrome [Massilia sp. LXY-6]|uniref:c-type cytochrome n=1 Tax=Massilia sp. LXY-6 TaxID=3379823 RepID=UPI003EDEBED2